MSAKDPNDGRPPQIMDLRAVCACCHHSEYQRHMMQTEKGLMCLFCFTDDQEELEYHELDTAWLQEEEDLITGGTENTEDD